MLLSVAACATVPASKIAAAVQANLDLMIGICSPQLYASTKDADRHPQRGIRLRTTLRSMDARVGAISTLNFSIACTDLHNGCDHFSTLEQKWRKFGLPDAP